ncbi:MAG: CHC2 zinc finger domain-containing protein [Pirellulales bacterium]|nr:CHC2 zinc finger domain-containing protein [Pirellulales bacterium]
MQTDLQSLIENDLGPGRRSGNRTFWICPFHEEKSGSLTVTPDGERYKCFGCGKSGDAIAWLMDRHSLTFRDAADRVGKVLDRPKKLSLNSDAVNSPPQPRFKAASTPPEADWRDKAITIIKQAETRLHSRDGFDALNYLFLRGLTLDTIKAGHLGLTADGGISIPWFDASGTPVFIQVRQLRKLPKYKAIPGGKRVDFYPRRPRPGRPCLIVEGEFDALLAAQDIGDCIDVCTLGGAADSLSSSAAMALCSASVVLIATDSDKAGDLAAETLRNVVLNSIRVLWPVGKDATECFGLRRTLRVMQADLPRCSAGKCDSWWIGDKGRLHCGVCRPYGDAYEGIVLLADGAVVER